jgi:hypothetical protein
MKIEYVVQCKSVPVIHTCTIARVPPHAMVQLRPALLSPKSPNLDMVQNWSLIHIDPVFIEM